LKVMVLSKEQALLWSRQEAGNKQSETS
jgi:hypothetical protein